MAGLNKTLRAQLHALLIDAYPTNDEFELFVGLQLEDVLAGDFPGGINLRILKLIQHFENRPLVLIQAALADPTHQSNTIHLNALQSIADQVQADLPLINLADPFDACIVEQGRPFINRSTLRGHLKQMSAAGGSRFLVINGNDGRGKSYSHFLVAAGQDGKEYKYCYIDLEPKTPGLYTPDLMAEAINSQLELPDTEAMPELQNVPERWAEELCTWLVNKIRGQEKTCWIVLDGFGNPEHGLPDETSQLVEALMLAVNDLNTDRARMILLDYHQPEVNMPKKVRPPLALTENLEAPDLNRDRLKRFLENAFRQLNIEFDDQMIEAQIDDTLNNLPAGAEEKLEEVQKRLLVTFRKLRT